MRVAAIFMTVILVSLITTSVADASPVLVCTSKAHPVHTHSKKGSPPSSGPKWTRKVYSELTNKDVFTCSNGQKEKLTELLMSGDYRLISLNWRTSPAPNAKGVAYIWYGVALFTTNNN